MSETVVITDTSVLINFLVLDRAGLLARLSTEVVASKVFIAKKIKFALKEHRKLVVCCREDDLPASSYNDLTKVIEKRKAVEIIDVRDWVVN